jgi:hypothetical protein
MANGTPLRRASPDNTLARSAAALPGAQAGVEDPIVTRALLSDADVERGRRDGVGPGGRPGPPLIFAASLS